MAMLEAKTKYGLVRGRRGEHTENTVFCGVPYAAPPVGELRFAPPVQPKCWEGVLDCTSFSSSCLQRKGSFGLYAKEFYPIQQNMSEDCLYLNIWTPAKSEEERLPVFFWIHGVAYMGGYSYEQEFDGEAMCGRGCILVSVEYRCNAMGFFAHPELTKRNGRSGNAGMEDQMFALKWVKENIAAFGGDPENITVHGQSAGAMSTKTLLTSLRCRGLMRRAILQSGGAINDWSDFRTMEEQEEIGVQLLERAGLTFEELMQLSGQEAYERLDAAAFALFGPPMGNLVFHPCLDGFNLSEPTGKSIREGSINTESLMVGGVTGDAGLLGLVSEEDPNAKQKQRVAAYSAANALGDWSDKQGRTPIYTYFFDHCLPGDENGSWHSCELWYMFGTLSRSWRPFAEYDYELSRAMVDYWCNFARTGEPNGEGLPRWNAYTAEAPETMCFSDEGFGMKDLNREPHAKEWKRAFLACGKVLAERL